MPAFYVVGVDEPGPLYVRLKYDGSAGVLRIHAWDPPSHGGPGPIEGHRVVRLGDALIGINDISLMHLGFRASILRVKEARRPCSLKFRRDLDGFRTDLPWHNSRKKGNAASDKYLYQVLDSNIIADHTLRACASSGSLDCSLRPLVWRLLLQFLPLERSCWGEQLWTQRKLYSQFVCEFTTSTAPNEVAGMRLHAQLSATPMTGGSFTCRPLHSDTVLRHEICMDVVRTCPELEVFWENGRKQESVQRILFIYAKLNPGVRYVQGMNEVVATLYYVFAMDENDEWSKYAEPDCFFCFTNLMADLQHLFIHSLDNSDSGISGTMARLNDMLHEYDPEVWEHLIIHQLNPSFYSVRWMTTLLSREFALMDTIRLWDALFAELARADLLCSVCVAMISSQRSALLRGDFSMCLRLLQNYPTGDLHTLLDKANQIRRRTSVHSAAERSRSPFVAFTLMRQVLASQP